MPCNFQEELTYHRASPAGPRTRVIQIRTSTRGAFRICFPLGTGFSESTAFCPGQPTDCSYSICLSFKAGRKVRRPGCSVYGLH